MDNYVTVFLIIFTPAVIVTGYVYLSKRRYEKARLKQKAKQKIRRKKP